MVMIAYGTRQSFGLCMQPMSIDMGWGREVLSVALATQNLLMGAGAAFAGALATRWGAAKTIAIGGGLYASGLFFHVAIDNAGSALHQQRNTLRPWA